MQHLSLADGPFGLGPALHPKSRNPSRHRGSPGSPAITASSLMLRRARRAFRSAYGPADAREPATVLASGPVRASAARVGELAPPRARPVCRPAGRPSSIAGRLACDKAATSTSHESDLSLHLPQIRRTNDGSWRHYLQGQSLTRLGAAANSDRRRASSRVAFIAVRRRPRRAFSGHSDAIRHRSSPTPMASAILRRPRAPARILALARRQTKPPNPPLASSSPGSAPATPSSRPDLTVSQRRRRSPTTTADKADLGISNSSCDTHSAWPKPDENCRDGRHTTASAAQD